MTLPLKDLIVDEPARGLFRVHRSVMTSSDIFRIEQERIFNQCWLYVGHESELPAPGDYKRRTIAGRPVVFVRSSDGQIRVLLNTCTHRGAMVCRQEEGNAKTFQCFYHAWTFNNAGALIGTPSEESYGSGFDPSERYLRQPAQVQDYRGLYFVSFNPDVPDLLTYLGDARIALDTFVDQGGEEGIRVLPGSFKYSVRANWKLMVENSADGYHGFPTHLTWIQWLRSQGREFPVGRSDYKTVAISYGHGHAAIGNLRDDDSMFLGLRVQPNFAAETAERVARHRARLMKRYGDIVATWSPAKGGISNTLIYPNMLLVHGMKSIRQIWPAGPDSMDITAWAVAPRSQSLEDIREVNREEFFDAQGPGGFQGPDDFEAIESCQLGFRVQEVEWSDMSRGMQRIPDIEDELFMRAFWRQWHANMLGLSEGPRNCDDWNDFAEFQQTILARRQEGIPSGETLPVEGIGKRREVVNG